MTEEDPLYVIRFFDIFFAEYPHEEIEMLGITIDRPFHEPIWRTIRRVRALYGFLILSSGVALHRRSITRPIDRGARRLCEGAYHGDAIGQPGRVHKAGPRHRT